MSRLHQHPATPQGEHLEGTRSDAEELIEETQPENAQKGGGFMSAARSKALRPFVIISSSYLLFTITDGAIRMIVLLHAYNKSFSALEVAIMFSLYELAGVFTNLAAGLMGAKWGIKFTLIIGLSLQLLSYGLMFGWQESWTKAQAMIYVTGKFSTCHERTHARIQHLRHSFGHLIVYLCSYL
jgi:Na+/melibiose symporter-like transporter